MSYVRFLGLKLLKERKRQAIVSTLGVAIGVAAYISMSSMLQGFHSYFVEQAVDLNAHITLSTEQKDDSARILKIAYGKNFIPVVLGSKPKDEKDKITGYKFIIDKYSTNPEIIGIAPHLTGQAIVRYGTKEKSVSMVGIDANLERKASVIDRFMELGNLTQIASERRSIIMGKLVAEDLGIAQKGKKVNLMAPNGTIHILKVVDFFKSGITDLDDTRVYLNLRTLQTILNRQNEVNELIFKIKDVDKAEKLAGKISAETGYYAESWQRAYENFLQLFKLEQMITNIIVFAILVVSAFGIFNIMMMTVLEKKKDIAILKAIGYRSEEITKIFVFQGLLIGTVGGVLGCALGYLVREWLGSIQFEFEAIISTEGFIMDRDPIYFVYGFIFAVFSALLASFYPSHKASKLFPVDIFRSGG